jgi:hypothetical protein
MIKQWVWNNLDKYGLGARASCPPPLGWQDPQLKTASDKRRKGQAKTDFLSPALPANAYRNTSIPQNNTGMDTAITGAGGHRII